MPICAHPVVSCINPYEIIRKYHCDSCGEVMMCSCEEEFARRFFPHQLSHGTDLHSKQRIPVTLGFQPRVCNTCRGKPEEAHPKAALYGRTSKIVRFYWREIAFRTTPRFAEWAESQGYSDWLTALREHKEMYNAIEREVIDEIKELHRRSPRYTYDEESQDEVLTRHKIEVIRLDAEYVKTPEGTFILDGNEPCSPEEFATRHFIRLGYEVIFAESTPFHVLFGVFMWMLIQDPSDPRNRIVGIVDRAAHEQGTKNKQIWSLLPEDFGSPGYGERRRSAIDAHIALLPQSKSDLLWTFDYWLASSADLRQYLWAHRAEDVERARDIITVLPVDVVQRILRYLVMHYWGRYLGWPDLLIHKEGKFLFTEIKSSKDKLSEEQKNWIRGNSSELNLPFKIVKIHRRSS